MPLDFGLLILQFGEQLAAQAQRVLVAERAILPRLMRRRDATRRAEWAMRDLPFLRFEDGAPVLRLAPFQAGALASEPGDGGLERALAPFRPDSEERAIGRFALALDRAALEVLDSLERFATATPRMFDARGAGDLPGVAALGWRALSEAARRGEEVTRLVTAGRHAYLGTTRAPSELDVFTRQVRDALGEIGFAPSAPGAPTDFGLTLAAGIVGLGTGALLIAETLKALGRRLPALGLEQLRAIERAVLDLRAALIRRVTTGVVAWADRAIDLATAFERVAGANIAFLIAFARRIGTDFLAGVGTFAKGFNDFLHGVVELLRAMPAVLTALTSFDFSGILNYVGGFSRLLLAGPLTLDRLLVEDGTKVNVALAALATKELDLAQQKALELRMVIGPAGDLAYQLALGRIMAARRLINALFPGWASPGSHKIEIPREAPPLQFKSNAPNLYDTLFGGGRGQRMLDLVDRIGAIADRQLAELAGDAREGLGAAALEFRRDAGAAARLGRPQALAGLSEQAAALFPPAEPAERRVSPLAGALESWLAGGGFTVIGSVIESYGKEIADRWEAHVEVGTEPAPPLTETSPLILRRRAVVGQVALPRLRVRVPAGRDLDAKLADEVADRFAAAMRDAYTTADARRAALAGAP